MTVPEEIMRGNNKINEKKVKRVEKIKKIILAAYFTTYNRVYE